MAMTAISEPDTMALAVTGVTKHYDSGFVLDDVTFDLPKGYIMADRPERRRKIHADQADPQHDPTGPRQHPGARPRQHH